MLKTGDKKLKEDERSKVRRESGYKLDFATLK